MPTNDEENTGHYAKFETNFGVQLIPDEKDVPSIKNEVRAISLEQQGCCNSKLKKQNARDFIKCIRCRKPRVIYILRKLKDRDNRLLQRIKATYGCEYECGCIILPEGCTALEGNVFTRVQMHCATPVETPFYQSSLIPGPKDICRHCAAPNTTVDPTLVGKFTTLIPACASCQAIGKKELKSDKRSQVC